MQKSHKKEQVIILQSHSPELPSQEYASSTKNNLGHKEKLKYEYIIQAENYSFKRANILIFPNEHCIALYNDIFPSNPKFDFILSGAKCNYNELSISDNLLDDRKINLLYIGRRNSIKGFDIVIEAFKKAYKFNNNINLIIVGNGEKVEEEGVIDIGFSKSPIAWYNSVDYVLNANRQSYFDLSVIEALSTGVPLIISENYGHKWFKDKSELITTFDGSTEKLFNILAFGNLQKRDKNNNSNKELYQNYLTDDLYYDRFKHFFNKLVEQK